MLPAPLPAVAPTYMARDVCGAGTRWRVFSGSQYVSPRVVGHVGNTRTLSVMPRTCLVRFNWESYSPLQFCGATLNFDSSEMFDEETLGAIRNTALFYPCSGNDLGLPISLFAPVVSDFYFVDLRMPRLPDMRHMARRSTSRRDDHPDEFVHLASESVFRVHRWQRHAEESLDDVLALGVFFFRGDNPVQGEGSSGVLWLGGDLFTRVLSLLVPGGLVVTDGSNPGPNGPSQLSAFYHNRDVGRAAVSEATPFEYSGRAFTCIGYVGEKNGPTLVWRAA